MSSDRLVSVSVTAVWAFVAAVCASFLAFSACVAAVCLSVTLWSASARVVSAAARQASTRCTRASALAPTLSRVTIISEASPIDWPVRKGARASSGPVLPSS